MSTTHACDQGEAVLAASPFTALQYHFGMLLGVEDLETAQAYARGKIRLHNAWQHGEGVLWGFNVLFDQQRALAVEPGLAVDAAGRELYLEHRACLDLGKWYARHKDDARFQFTDAPNNGRKFTAHVVARFRACLARPVPAIADACEGAQGDTAYSRALETVDLLLYPGKAPLKKRPYTRLRVLFQVAPDAAEFDDVRVRREAIQAMPLADQPREFLKAFREFAALDTLDLEPQQASPGGAASIFPEEPTEVVLADLEDIVVEPGANGTFAIATPLPTPDVTVRHTIVATTTIQELNGPFFRGSDGGGAAAPDPVRDAGGPRIDPASVTIDARRIVFSTTTPLAPSSVITESISVTAFEDAEGWSDIDAKAPTLDAAGTTVTLELKEEAPAGHTIRLLVRGTGPYPLLGQTLVPLAGAVGGPHGTPHDGHDFVLMAKRS